MDQQRLVYMIAQHELKLGVKETPGKASNPRIELYHLCSLLRNTTDDVPWCASAMNFCHIMAALILNPELSERDLLKARYREDEIFKMKVEAAIIGAKLGIEPSVELHKVYDLGTHMATARSFLNNGIVSLGEVGDTCILSRTNNPAQGHVGILIEKNFGFVKLLGGNQKDMWCIESYSRCRVLGYRRVI